MIGMKRVHKSSLTPEIPVHDHAEDLQSTTSIVTICGYGEDFYWEEQTMDPEECKKVLERKAPMLWINVDGLAQTEILRVLGNHFNLHNLTLEDILNTTQRPRQEAFESYTYLVFKVLNYNTRIDQIESEQISLIIGDNYVISFRESDKDNFGILRKRVQDDKSIFRKRSVDYLAYSLIDIVVDGYYAVLEKSGELLESLEDALLANPDEKTLQDIHCLKREMLKMRQAVWPLRETLVGLEQSNYVFVHTEAMLHLRDVYSHVVQIIDNIEIYREMLTSLFDLYLSNVNNRLNEVMKVLTIFAAIFIPLTLISGIYGMNFKYMPELNWFYGYPFAIGLMAAVTIAMLYYFRRKKWL